MLCEVSVELTKLTLVQDLAAVMLAAGLVAALFHYLGWPKVIGYIAAGVLMGLPQVKPFLIANESSVNTLANLGVIFLMFTLGLELNIRQLKKLGNVAFPAATLDVLLMLLAGYALGRHVFHWGMVPSIFLGAVVCDSSTTLLAKSLEEMGCSRERFANVIFGITLSEDIVTIGVMAILSGLVLTGTFQAGALARQLGLLCLFLTGVFVFGLLVLPRFLDRIKEMKDEETLVIIILGICFGIAFIAEQMNFSLALGAFLVGAVVSESSVSKRVHANTGALKNMFSAVFFVAVGLMVDLGQIWDNLGRILLLSLLVLVCKTLNNLLATFAFGQPHKDALKIGIGLAQIGDFSYLVALLGITLTGGKQPYPQMYQLAVGTSILTTLVNPFLLKASVPVGNWLDRKLPQRFRQALESYNAWAQRTGRLVTVFSKTAEFRKSLIFLLLDYALIAVIFLVAHYFNDRTDLWSRTPTLLRRTHSALLWVGACICSIPVIVSAFLNARNLGEEIARVTVPSFLSGRMSSAMRRLAKLVTMGICLVVLVLELADLSSMLFFSWTVLCCILLLFAVLLFFSWKKIRQFAEEGQNTLAMVMEREDREDDAPDGEDHLPIPSHSCLLGHTLQALRLRNRTGVSILSIQHANGQVTNNPGPKTILQTGDIVQCAGTPEERNRLQQLAELSELPDLPEDNPLTTLLNLQVKPIRIEAGTIAVGKTLKELRLRNRAGTTVVRVARPGLPAIENPGPDLVLAEGFILSIIGSSEQLEATRQILDAPLPLPKKEET
ncbi:MAG: cation:proton antiporter [Victivallales bacterium]|nr:cation:proton antiporter [Victivallales bacterium]